MAARRRMASWSSRRRCTLSRSMLGIVLLSAVFAAGADIAAAHTPHDDVFDVAVSPTYVTDQTVFAISPRHPPEEHERWADVAAPRQGNRQPGGPHRVGDVDSDPAHPVRVIAERRHLPIEGCRSIVVEGRSRIADGSDLGTGDVTPLGQRPLRDRCERWTVPHG